MREPFRLNRSTNIRNQRKQIYRTNVTAHFISRRTCFCGATDRPRANRAEIFADDEVQVTCDRNRSGRVTKSTYEARGNRLTKEVGIQSALSPSFMISATSICRPGISRLDALSPIVNSP